MTYHSHLTNAAREMQAARALIQDEIRAYPTPISGCDVQYNHLISLRNTIAEALAALDTPAFVATPRTPYPNAGVESR